MSTFDILGTIDINDYTYPLPEEKIAKFPLQERDHSKLLVYNGEMITSSHFSCLTDFLPHDSHLVLNNTKVVWARLFFRKESGAVIEIFCNDPSDPLKDIQLAFQQMGEATWRCLVGNARRWKNQELVAELTGNGKTIRLHAKRLSKESDIYLIKFRWEPMELTFAEILEYLGNVPLPPYLNRASVDSDKNRYQTMYANSEGSVAAPTAGLHFTKKVFQSLSEKGITHDFLTLHVGAGTFKPVGSDGIAKHIMHSEQVAVTRSTIEKLSMHSGNIIAVGTTSVRTIESIYWFGVRLKSDPDASFAINQHDPYLTSDSGSVKPAETLLNVLNYFDRHRIDHIYGTTRLLIVPGYEFKLVTGMVTNFHQPRSTLLLLIAAFLGKKWKEVYDYALANDFRFLSYGDACLFLR